MNKFEDQEWIQEIITFLRNEKVQDDPKLEDIIYECITHRLNGAECDDNEELRLLKEIHEEGILFMIPFIAHCIKTGCSLEEAADNKELLFSLMNSDGFKEKMKAAAEITEQIKDE